MTITTDRAREGQTTSEATEQITWNNTRSARAGSLQTNTPIPFKTFPQEELLERRSQGRNWASDRIPHGHPQNSYKTLKRSIKLSYDDNPTEVTIKTATSKRRSLQRIYNRKAVRYQSQHKATLNQRTLRWSQNWSFHREKRGTNFLEESKRETQLLHAAT